MHPSMHSFIYSSSFSEHIRYLSYHHATYGIIIHKDLQRLLSHAFHLISVHSNTQPASSYTHNVGYADATMTYYTTHSPFPTPLPYKQNDCPKNSRLKSSSLPGIKPSPSVPMPSLFCPPPRCSLTSSHLSSVRHKNTLEVYLIVALPSPAKPKFKTLSHSVALADVTQYA
jgi:hypothetical protein